LGLECRLCCHRARVRFRHGSNRSVVHKETSCDTRCNSEKSSMQQMVRSVCPACLARELHRMRCFFTFCCRGKHGSMSCVTKISEFSSFRNLPCEAMRVSSQVRRIFSLLFMPLPSACLPQGRPCGRLRPYLPQARPGGVRGIAGQGGAAGLCRVWRARPAWQVPVVAPEPEQGVG